MELPEPRPHILELAFEGSPFEGADPTGKAYPRRLQDPFLAFAGSSTSTGAVRSGTVRLRMPAEGALEIHGLRAGAHLLGRGLDVRGGPLTR